MARDWFGPGVISPAIVAVICDCGCVWIMVCANDGGALGLDRVEVVRLLLHLIHKRRFWLCHSLCELTKLVRQGTLPLQKFVPRTQNVNLRIVSQHNDGRRWEDPGFDRAEADYFGVRFGLQTVKGLWIFFMASTYMHMYVYVEICISIPICTYTCVYICIYIYIDRWMYLYEK